jgi:hypothetical protein
VDRRENGFRVDMHVKVLDERVVRRAKSRGLDALVYAPHFTTLPEVERRAAAYSDDDLLVIPGREIFTGGWLERRHLLVIGLAEPIPDFVTLAGAFEEIDRQNALALVPHPEFLTVSLDEAAIERYRSSISAIEVYNAKFRARDGRRATRLARRVGLPVFVSSYAHLRRTVGEAWTTFDRASIEPGAGPNRSPRFRGTASQPESGTGASVSHRVEREAETGTANTRSWDRKVAGFVAALEGGARRSIDRRSGPGHRGRSLAEFAHLGYENSLSKAPRVLSSKPPATHPGQSLYGGRFDDVRVY